MSKRIILIIIVIVGMLGGAWIQLVNIQDTPKHNEVVRIGGLPIVQGLPLFLALEKGYFIEEGIDVEWIKFEAPNQLIDALLARQIDITHTGGPMSIAAIVNAKQPNSLKIYAAAGGDTVVPNDSIMIRNGLEITSLQDLKGKRIGILSGIQWRTIAQHIFAQNNLDKEDITLVELAPALQPSALASGQIDALLAIEPIPTIVKEKSIGTELIKTPTALYVANPFYGGAGVVSVQFLEDRPEVAMKVLKVLQRAVEEVKRNPNAARPYLQKYTALDQDLIQEVPIPIIKMFNDLDTADIASIQKFLDIFLLYGVVSTNLNITDNLYHTPRE